MSNLIPFAPRRGYRLRSQADTGAGASLRGDELRRLREERGILRRQLADVLNVSVATIERWEKAETTTLSEPEFMQAATRIRLSDSEYQLGKNLCFGRFPLRVARELLGVTSDKMASDFGYSPSTWRKIENHERSIPRNVMSEIEESIRSIVNGSC